MQVPELFSAAKAAKLRNPEDTTSQLILCRKADEQVSGKKPVSKGTVAELVLFWISWDDTLDKDVPHVCTQLKIAAAQLLLRTSKAGGSAASAHDVQPLIPGFRRAISLRLQHFFEHHRQQWGSQHLDCICSLVDALVVVPQLVTPSERHDIVVAAIDAIIHALGSTTRRPADELVTMGTAVFYKLLKALQSLIAEAKKEHHCNLGVLVPALQKLLAVGAQQLPDMSRPSAPCLPAGVKVKSEYSNDQPGPLQSSLLPTQTGWTANPNKAASSTSINCPTQQQTWLDVEINKQGVEESRGRKQPQTGINSHRPAERQPSSASGRSGAYLPPHLRRPSQLGVPCKDSDLESLAQCSEDQRATPGSFKVSVDAASCSTKILPSTAAGSPHKQAASQLPKTAEQRPCVQGERGRAWRRTMSSSDRSDSEASDSDSTGGGGCLSTRVSRVRLGALAAVQALAKADSKALHSSWTDLLPSSDSVLSGHPGQGQWTLGHVLLHDPIPRVRHAAAVTINNLLEGPAQRAYMGIAECSGLHGQRTRGFITLSMSLGLVSTVLHTVLLQALRNERDPGVQLGVLRALCTLLLAAPYHRLPPDLLPRCVGALHQMLLQSISQGSPRVVFAPPATPQTPSDAAPLAAACLSCLAAAFGTKHPSQPLRSYLCGQDCCHTKGDAGADGHSIGAGGCRGSGILHSSTSATGHSGCATAEGQPSGSELVQLLFKCAHCGNPSVELEAVMALRGMAQLYCSALSNDWDSVLGLAQLGVAGSSSGGHQSPRAQQGTSTREKLAHQSVRLAGDWLAAMDPHSPQASNYCPGPNQRGVGLAGHHGGSPSQPPPGAAVHRATASPSNKALHTTGVLGQGGLLDGDGDCGVPARKDTNNQDSSTERAQHAQRWRVVADSVVRTGVQQESSVVRCAAHSVVAGMSPRVWASLEPAVQRQLMQWCCEGAASDESSPVRAAAAKALGALCRCSACWADFAKAPQAGLSVGAAGLDLVVPALQSSCGDTVLTVRVQAVAALSELCRSLQGWLGCSVQPGQALGRHQHPAVEHPSASFGAVTLAVKPQRCSGVPGKAGGQPPAAVGGVLPAAQRSPLSVSTTAVQRLPSLLSLAAGAAGDSEKVQGGGVESLGLVFACLGGAIGGLSSTGVPTSPRMLPSLTAQHVEEAAAALAATLHSGVPKIQWNACIAAGQLLSSCNQASASCHAGEAGNSDSSGGWVGALLRCGSNTVQALQQVWRGGHSMRSRVLAAVSLQRIGTPSWCASAYWDLLEATAEALLDGDAEGGQLAAASSLIEHADASLKPKLETEQLKLFLHLLALLLPNSVEERGNTAGGIGKSGLECVEGLGLSKHQQRISTLLLGVLQRARSAEVEPEESGGALGQRQETLVWERSTERAMCDPSLKALFDCITPDVCALATTACLGWLRFASAMSADVPGCCNDFGDGVQTTIDIDLVVHKLSYLSTNQPSA